MKRMILFVMTISLLAPSVVFASEPAFNATDTGVAARRATLKAAIQNASDLNTACLVNGDLTTCAKLLNDPAAPTFTVWKTYVWPGDVGKTFNATELAGLTQLNTTRLQNLHDWLENGINPSTAGVRQFFDDVFSGAGGANTRAALLTLWKRTATRLEKVFATGTGSDPSPATIVVEGAVTSSELVGVNTW